MDFDPCSPAALIEHLPKAQGTKSFGKVHSHQASVELPREAQNLQGRWPQGKSPGEPWKNPGKWDVQWTFDGTNDGKIQ